MNFWRSLEAGDWVSTIETTNITFTDHFAGTGLPPGTRGVITSRTGSKATVELEAGYGTVTASLPARLLRPTRPGGGIKRFRQHVGFLTIVRTALACFLLWPLVQYAIDYLLTYRSFDGFIESLPLAALESTGESILIAFSQPGPALLYMTFLILLGWIAFPWTAPWNRRHRRK